MFRKIVANLAFSPALIGQLGFYAKRLKKEEATRRLGLVFTALALIVQSLTVLTPPESANAANDSDMIRGGVSSKKAILAEYDKRRSDFKDIMDYAGITRAELAGMKEGSVNSRGQGTGAGSWKTWGRKHVFSAAQGEVKHVVPLDTGGNSTLYSKPYWLYDSKSYTIKNGSTYAAFVGHSKERGMFAIIKGCGNLVTKTTPKPDVGARFIAATCDTIRGKATDGRDKNARLKVFLYYEGPPGKGVKSAAITTQKDGTFTVKVPERYQKKQTWTQVWGVMVPLAGWSDSTVQFDRPATIPGGCVQPKPAARCVDLSFDRISRTSFKLNAKAMTDNGASIKGYSFVVTDASGKQVLKKDVSGKSLSASSGTLDLQAAGTYKAAVTVDTSVGKKSAADCTHQFTVAPPTVPAVDIDKKVDGVKQKRVGVNQEFTYQLTVTNTGETDLKNVAVTDTPPNGVSLLSASAGSVKANKWSHTIPTLSKGQNVTFTLKAKVTAYTPGNLVNTACVNAKEVNPGQPTKDDDCDTATVTVVPPMIEVCERETKTIISIQENEFDATKHSKNKADCADPCKDNNPACVHVTEAKVGTNLTQNVDATTIKAQASDRIEYTIHLENVGSVATTRTINEELSDVMEYATLSHNGGGSYDDGSKILSWGDVTLQPGEKTSRSFVVQIMAEIPTMAQGSSEPSSYDCVMTNSFGNTVNIDVNCETPKLVESTVSELPKTGPGENMIFAIVVGSVVTFFWARSRQLGREVKLIRKDFNMGTI